MIKLTLDEHKTIFEYPVNTQVYKMIPLIDVKKGDVILTWGDGIINTEARGELATVDTLENCPQIMVNGVLTYDRMEMVKIRGGKEVRAGDLQIGNELLFDDGDTVYVGELKGN